MLTAINQQHYFLDFVVNLINSVAMNHSCWST